MHAVFQAGGTRFVVSQTSLVDGPLHKMPVRLGPMPKKGGSSDGGLLFASDGIGLAETNA
jgi:hypothetical protein